MNLKEAFRFQNRLQRLMSDALCILRREDNLVTVEITKLIHKTDPQREDETSVLTPDCEYAEDVNRLAAFLLYLLEQREKLGYAIRGAKRSMDIDFDGEVSLNTKRQEIASVFRDMAAIRGYERVSPGGGTAYKFNAEGNQVSFCCDVKRVTTINFDRNKIRSYVAGLNKKSDGISAELDKCLVTSQVAYEPPFDVNDTFSDVFAKFLEANA
ncbi:MAG: hypothetical protein IKU07_06955 [Oscillospiraceae bacterium]|nr:hypothetical protein [Oscillospiraceae bacterium]